uniref:WD repeat-containing protein 44 n=1 Tax=Elaeophora elaphi TaxID=1147741 RepID=A0A0R3S3Q4_9BILA
MSFAEVEENAASSTTNSEEYEDAQDELRPLPELSTLIIGTGRGNNHPSRHDSLPIENEVNDSTNNKQLPLPSQFGNISTSSISSSLKDGIAADRRYRLDALRNRMTSEFGSGHTLLNTGVGGCTDDDAGSASESASLASWGRNLLIQAPYTKMKLVYPADTISTKAFSSHQNLSSGTDSFSQNTNFGSDNGSRNVESTPSSHSPASSLTKISCNNAAFGVKLPPPHSHPPPLPPRRPCGRLPNALSPQQVDSLIGKGKSPTKEVEEAKIDASHSSLHTVKPEKSLKKDIISLVDGFARLRGHAKTNSLDRGLSLAKSIKSGPFPPPSDKSNSLKREYFTGSPCSSPYLSFDGEEDLRNSDAQGVIRQITSSILNEPLKEELLATESSPVRGIPSGRLSSVGEEFSTNSSISTCSPIKSGLNDCRTADNASQDKLYKLQITIPKSASHSKMDSDSSSRDFAVGSHSEPTPEQVSMKDDSTAQNAHTEYSDPITRDVERRMSMKGHQQTSGELDDGPSHIAPPLSSFGRAAGFVKGYGTYASELFRGAFLRAKSVVSSGSTSKFSKEDDESCNESEHEDSAIAEGTPIVRPRNSKKGPFDFDGTRCYQELNNEHTGAVWCMKFSLCGRLLATAGQDSIIRVWVLRNHLSYFNALRDRYNSHSKKISMTVGENVLQNAMQDIENDLRSSSTTLGESAGSSTSHDDENGSLTTALMASKPLCTYRSHTADVLDLSWSRNYFILSSGMDRTVKLWHLSRPECLCCFQHMDFVTCIAFMPKDDRYFLSGSLDGKLRLWHIPDKKVALWNEVEQVKFITAIAFAKNGKFAVVGTYDGRCFFYTTDQLKYHTVIDVRSSRGKNARGHKVTGLAVHGDKLLVTSNDSRIRMYDLRDMALTCKFKGAQNERSQIRASLSPDGKHIVCGSEDRFIYIWTTADLPSSLAVRKDRNDSWQRLRGHSACVTVAIFAPRPQLFLNLLEQRRGGDDRSEQSKSSKNMSDRQIHGDVIISADLNGSIRIFVNRTKIKAGSSNFFPTD